MKGTTEAGSTVHLYKQFNCTGVRLALGSAAQFASPGLTASVPDNTTNLFRARTIDRAGNISTCSASFRYDENSTLPPTGAAAEVRELSEPGSIFSSFTLAP